MDDSQIMKELTDIFIEVFDDEGIMLSRITCAKDIADWDSLAQIILLSEIQKRFKISFTVQEIAKLQNVGEMADLIIEKLERQ